MGKKRKNPGSIPKCVVHIPPCFHAFGNALHVPPGRSAFTAKEQQSAKIVVKVEKSGAPENKKRVRKGPRKISKIQKDNLHGQALHSAFKGKNWKAAIESLSQMRRDGIVPSTVQWNKVISVCGKCGQSTFLSDFSVF